MASLYETSVRIRKGSVIILVLSVMYIGADTAIKYLQSPLSPFSAGFSAYADPSKDGTEIPKPQIPSLTLPADTVPIFTVEGAFPKNPDSALVYRIEKPREKLDTFETAQRIAQNLGFSADPNSIDGDLLTWENTPSLTRKLTFDKVTQVWNMTTQYFQDIIALQTKTINENTESYRGTGIASAIGFKAESLLQGISQVTLAKLGLNGLFTKPLSATSADYVVIDVFRELPLAILKSGSQLPEGFDPALLPPAYDGKVYTNDPRVGSLRMVGTNNMARLNEQIMEINFIDYDYDPDYMVRAAITPEEAWNRVSLGGGALVILQDQTADFFASNEQSAVTRFIANASETEIAFWEPDPWDGFLYPVYVFRGRAEFADKRTGKFVFYVDALRRVD